MFDRVDNDTAPAVHARSAATPGVVAQQPGTRRTSRLGLRSLTAAALVAMVLAACGGGGDGGVGTNGTGITMGTVNGFGSVIVDGVRFDDSKALVQVETSAAGDSYLPAEVKLGQRTRIEYSGTADDTVSSKGVASRVEVDPSIIGIVTGKGLTTTRFTVLGQTVDVNATVGPVPVTVFEGYLNGFDDIVPGDWVEVHALRSGSGASATFQATRVEKLKAASTFVRVSGIVGTDLQTGSTKTFRIGGLTVGYGAATVLPAAASLASGAAVVVFAPVVGDPNAVTLAASKVRVHATTTVSTSDDIYVGGLVSGFVAGSRMVVDGVDVNLASAPVVSGTVVDGVYVRVKGRYTATGEFRATTVQVRNGGDDSGSSELRGTVFDFVAPVGSTPGSFTVRDTLVQQPVTVLPTSCSGVTFGNGVFVEVKGVATTTGVMATSIECEDSNSVPGSIVEIHGTVNALPTSTSGSGTFTLNSGGTAPQLVAFSSTTFLRDITLRDLTVGRSIEVEGALSGGVLNATKIKLDD
jgi:hypothetical protein